MRACRRLRWNSLARRHNPRWSRRRTPTRFMRCAGRCCRVWTAAGVPKEAQFARRLAENGCRVLVPVLIDRKDTWSGNPKLGRMTNQPHREFIYRMAYEMGRHIIGYEVQKVLAAVDWFTREKKH